MAVSADIRFGRGRGVATIDPRGRMVVEWDERAPLLFGRIMSNEVIPLTSDVHFPKLPASAIEFDVETEEDFAQAVELAQQLNLLWDAAKRRGITVEATSDQFSFRFREPNTDQPHLSEPSSRQIVVTDDEGNEPQR